MSALRVLLYKYQEDRAHVMQLLENTGRDEGNETAATEQLLEITGIRSSHLFAIVGRVSNPTECDR